MIQRKNSNIYPQQSYSPFKIFQTAKNMNRTKQDYNEMSPRQSLSPLKRNMLYSKTSNRSKSPLINCSKNNCNSQNRNLSPLRRFSSRLPQQSQVQATSFSKLSKKSSNYSTNQRTSSGFNCSTNYLQSDRFANTETNLFTKLAAQLNQSNKNTIKDGGNDFSNKKKFSQGVYSQQQDVQVFRAIPQSSRFNNSNKKSFTNLFINNVTTIQSVQQSPQDQRFSFNYPQNKVSCKQFQYPTQFNEKHEQRVKQKKLLQPSMKKKSSIENNKNLQNYSQKKNQNQNDIDSRNSFGIPNIKGVRQNQQIKSSIKPFEQIQAVKLIQSIKQANHPQIRLLNFLDPSKGELSSQQIEYDSQFESIKFIIDKLGECVYKKNQSQDMGHNVNVSLSASQDSLNMNPYL